MALVFNLIFELFDIEKTSLPISSALACCVVASEYVVYYYSYTGAVVNCLSGIFAVASMTFLLRAFRTSASSYHHWWASVFFLLSILSKEDFVLPVLAFCAYFAFIEKDGRLIKVRAVYTLAVLFCIAAAVLFFERFVIYSPFLNFRGFYSVNLAPMSILSMFGRYLCDSFGSKAALVAQLLSIPIALSFMNRVHLGRFFLVQAIALLLIAPFSLLTRHVYLYYSVNWIVWQYGLLLVVQSCPSNYRKSTMIAFLMTLVPIVIFGSRPLRERLLTDYEHQQLLNGNILRVLNQHRSELERYPEVNVIGLTEPWCPWVGFNPERYLSNKLGLNCRWTVFAAPSSPIFIFNESCIQTEDGSYFRNDSDRRCEIKDLRRYPKSSKIPVLVFRPDGVGILCKP